MVLVFLIWRKSAFSVFPAAKIVIIRQISIRDYVKIPLHCKVSTSPPPFRCDNAVFTHKKIHRTRLKGTEENKNRRNRDFFDWPSRGIATAGSHGIGTVGVLPDVTPSNRIATTWQSTTHGMDAIHIGNAMSPRTMPRSGKAMVGPGDNPGIKMHPQTNCVA